MDDRDIRRRIAAENLEIFRAGGYAGPQGQVGLSDALRAAISGSHTYTPEAQAALVAGARRASKRPTRFEVTGETTGAAARRLAHDDPHVAMLNFAAARAVGGGFLHGARAQEEELCRMSGLYPCLEGQSLYYAENRAHSSPLYSDHLIYSPGVPFFREGFERTWTLLPEPWHGAVLTSPAPNAKTHLAAGGDPAALRPAFARRLPGILAVAEAHAHRTLVLGAWGCGAFGNDPEMVADVFAEVLRGPRFGGAFEHVVFAILHDAWNRENFEAFARRFE